MWVLYKRHLIQFIQQQITTKLNNDGGVVLKRSIHILQVNTEIHLTRKCDMLFDRYTIFVSHIQGWGRCSETDSMCQVSYTHLNMLLNCLSLDFLILLPFQDLSCQVKKKRNGSLRRSGGNRRRRRGSRRDSR